MSSQVANWNGSRKARRPSASVITRAAPRTLGELGQRRVERLGRDAQSGSRSPRGQPYPAAAAARKGSRAHRQDTLRALHWTRPDPGGSLASARQRGIGEPVGEIEVMVTYWTVSGPVVVHFGREWSTFSWEDRCAHAQRVGFTGLGLWHADVEHQLETTTLAGDGQVFRDHGLKYLEVEFLADFFAPEGSEARKASDAQRRKLFETAAAFDAHHIKVGNIPETPVRARPGDRGVRGAVRRRRQPHRRQGRLRDHPVRPQRRHARGRRCAWSARPTGPTAGWPSTPGTWASCGIDPERAGARSPPSTSPGWSCPTASSSTWRTRSTRSINHRAAPGRGRVRHPRVRRARCTEAGYPGPWGAEILSEKLRNLPIEQEFDRAYETTLAQVRAGVE